MRIQCRFTDKPNACAACHGKTLKKLGKTSWFGYEA
jgi:hypothetical protein